MEIIMAINESLASTSPINGGRKGQFRFFFHIKTQERTKSKIFISWNVPTVKIFAKKSTKLYYIIIFIYLCFCLSTGSIVHSSYMAHIFSDITFYFSIVKCGIAGQGQNGVCLMLFDVIQIILKFHGTQQNNIYT